MDEQINHIELAPRVGQLQESLVTLQGQMRMKLGRSHRVTLFLRRATEAAFVVRRELDARWYRDGGGVSQPVESPYHRFRELEESERKREFEEEEKKLLAAAKKAKKGQRKQSPPDPV